TGSLTIANNLTVNGNIKTTGIISGSSLPPNLIRNSYMNILDGNKPAGYRVLGNVNLEAAHPYTKGFEGPYVAEKPSNAASSVDTATQANPYWFRRYYKGSRASRGGLADGWNGLPDGRILKITGNNSAVHTSVMFPFESNVLTNKVHFKAWLKITSGSKVGFGVDSGYRNVVRGLIITKEQTDDAPDGWYQIDAVIGTSEVTSLNGLAFSMGIEASGSFEVYLALPYVANLDNDTWLPSVSDMLSRDGLTVHPSSRNVGIGTDSPEGKLDVRGDIRAGNSDIYFTNTNHNHTGIGNKSGWAAIENAANFGALMILGRAGTSKGRYVRLWDYLQVNGGMDITGNVGIGTSNPRTKLEVAGTVNVRDRILRNGQDFSKAGLASHNDTVKVPWGTTREWNIFVSPRVMGREEPDSEGDNALLKIECWARVNNTTSWKNHARYKYRIRNGDGRWYDENSGRHRPLVNYILIPR
ncbi:MAG: hypothetical protein F6K50_22395, partial [Moorea sp. SIO3I7]|nr:hypothetical protein [Moorena sp. SIO3I7]